MRDFYSQYCQDKAGVWSESARRSEGVRLNRLWHVIDGDALKLWNEMLAQGYHPNARCTYWTRVSAFWDWLIEQKHTEAPNPYKVFRAKNARAFRGAYERKPCKIPFNELMARIEKIPEPEYRNKAKQLLIGGLRVTESDTLQDGHVIGKGNKKRKVYVPALGPMVTKQQYSGLLRRCHKYLGVTPHKLRSARMTDLARKGMKTADMTAFAGWSNFAVAQSYIAANESEIERLVQQRETKVNSMMGMLKFIAKRITAKVTS
jgi:integrase